MLKMAHVKIKNRSAKKFFSSFCKTLKHLNKIPIPSDGNIIYLNSDAKLTYVYVTSGDFAPIYKALEDNTPVGHKCCRAIVSWS